MAIYSADMRRGHFGANLYEREQAGVKNREEAIFNNKENKIYFFVRERGSFTFTLVELQEKTMKELVKQVLNKLKPREKNLWKNNDDLRLEKNNRIYGVYTTFTKLVVLTDEDLQSLPDNGAELEVIIV